MDANSCNQLDLRINRVYPPLCEFPECFELARYGFINDQRTCCRMHRAQKMINFGRYCENPGCQKIANYGFPKETLRFCKDHMVFGMCINTKFCEHNGCFRKADHGFANKLQYCTYHCKPGMFLINKKKLR